MLLMSGRDEKDGGRNRRESPFERVGAAQPNFYVGVHDAEDEVDDEVQDVGEGKEELGVVGEQTEQIEAELLLEGDCDLQDEHEDSEHDRVDEQVEDDEIPELKLEGVFVHLEVRHLGLHAMQLAGRQKEANVEVVERVGRGRLAELGLISLGVEGWEGGYYFRQHPVAYQFFSFVAGLLVVPHKVKCALVFEFDGNQQLSVEEGEAGDVRANDFDSLGLEDLGAERARDGNEGVAQTEHDHEKPETVIERDKDWEEREAAVAAVEVEEKNGGQGELQEPNAHLTPQALAKAGAGRRLARVEVVADKGQGHPRVDERDPEADSPKDLETHYI